MGQQVQVPSKEKCKMEQTKLDVLIEKGMSDGSEIKFERMSEQKPGQIPGDVIVKLKQKPDARFKRRGNDLHTEMTITLKDALLGFTRTLHHLDGHEVIIENKGITAPRQVFKIAEEGMPVHNFPSQAGDLHVMVQIQMPTSLTAQLRAMVESAL